MRGILNYEKNTKALLSWNSFLFDEEIIINRVSKQMMIRRKSGKIRAMGNACVGVSRVADNLYGTLYRQILAPSHLI